MSEIADKLIDWYGVNGRNLPWRRTRDPYRIWLSEVILQQTRIAQGMDYYLRFVARFPDVGALAAADEDEVLKLWQGLGYYSRARNLHAAARQVVERYGGRFPAAYADVRSLKGVGDYTAAAVCSIAYDAPCAVVDGNVYRVLSRLFDLDLAIDTAEGRKAFAALADEQLDRRRPARYNQAIMDFGALQCTPANPSCNDCPLRDECLSLAAGTVAERPVKAATGRRHLAGIVRPAGDRERPPAGFHGAGRRTALPRHVRHASLPAGADDPYAQTPAVAPDPPRGVSPPRARRMALRCRRVDARAVRTVGGLCDPAPARPLFRADRQQR